MKVLFVSSGNSTTGINQIIKNQGDSLKEQGIELDYFTISKKGFVGYLTAIFKLRKYLSHNEFDLLHAHYYLSGIVARLSTKKPVVVSLMGSDLHSNLLRRNIIYLLSKYFWDSVIVKSAEMAGLLKNKKVHIIPNGVDLKHFKFIEKNEAIKRIGFNENMKNILFVSYSYENVIRQEKNFNLAEKSVKELNRPEVKLNVITYADFDLMPCFYYASDALLFTSKREGSPNVVKEAMACNLPVIATNVGDIKYLFENTSGCYITGFNSSEIVSKLKTILDNNVKSNGRNRIISIHLDSISVAEKIINIYRELMINV